MGNGEWGMGNGKLKNGEWEIKLIFSAAIITANGRGDLSVSLFQYLSN